MKTILALLIPCLALAEPTPEEIAASRKAEIVRYVKAIKAEVESAQAEARDALVANEMLLKINAAQNEKLAGLGGVKAALELAQVEAVKVQRVIDAQADVIAKQAASLQRWRTFGHAVLVCISGVVFVFVWQFLGRFPFAIAGPWALAIRVGVSLAAGLSAAAAVFRIVTQVL